MGQKLEEARAQFNAFFFFLIDFDYSLLSIPGVVFSFLRSLLTHLSELNLPVEKGGNGAMKNPLIMYFIFIASLSSDATREEQHLRVGEDRPSLPSRSHSNGPKSAASSVLIKPDERGIRKRANERRKNWIL